MKIVTVNVPESYLDSIEKLIGEEGLYPSRSELIRVAVREFLLKEIEIAKKIQLQTIPEPDLDDPTLVRIPSRTRDENNEPKIEFKTYKVLRRLE